MANRNTPAIVNDTALATDDMFSDARVEMIRNQVAKGAPDDLFMAMLDLAKRRRLDPLAKQISLISFKNRKAGTTSWAIITTIDGYRALAEQTGLYAGSDAPVFTYAGEKTAFGKTAPETATVTVHKLINGTPYPFSATVYFEEYSTGQNNWNTMPRTMLAKVAESHALRKAFPAVMSGMYEESEMDQAIEGTARVVDTGANSGIRVDSSGEIHEITGRTERPPRTSAPPITATVETADDAKAKAMKRLHAVAAKHNICHDDLHLQAVKNGGKSLADYDAKVLNDTANAIENRTADALAYYERLRTEAAELTEANAAIDAQLDAKSNAQGGK